MQEERRKKDKLRALERVLTNLSIEANMRTVHVGTIIDLCSEGKSLIREINRRQARD